MVEGRASELKRPPVIGSWNPKTLCLQVLLLEPYDFGSSCLFRSFSWRHWGHFTGSYQGQQGFGELVEMYGFAVAEVDDQLLGYIQRGTFHACVCVCRFFTFSKILYVHIYIYVCISVLIYVYIYICIQYTGVYAYISTYIHICRYGHHFGLPGHSSPVGSQISFDSGAALVGLASRNR